MKQKLNLLTVIAVLIVLLAGLTNAQTAVEIANYSFEEPEAELGKSVWVGHGAPGWEIFRADANTWITRPSSSWTVQPVHGVQYIRTAAAGAEASLAQEVGLVFEDWTRYTLDIWVRRATGTDASGDLRFYAAPADGDPYIVSLEPKTWLNSIPATSTGVFTKTTHAFDTSIVCDAYAATFLGETIMAGLRIAGNGCYADCITMTVEDSPVNIRLRGFDRNWSLPVAQGDPVGSSYGIELKEPSTQNVSVTITDKSGSGLLSIDEQPAGSPATIQIPAGQTYKEVKVTSAGGGAMDAGFAELEHIISTGDPNIADDVLRNIYVGVYNDSHGVNMLANHNFSSPAGYLVEDGQLEYRADVIPIWLPLVWRYEGIIKYPLSSWAIQPTSGTSFAMSHYQDDNLPTLHLRQMTPLAVEDRTVYTLKADVRRSGDGTGFGHMSLVFADDESITEISSDVFAMPHGAWYEMEVSLDTTTAAQAFRDSVLHSGTQIGADVVLGGNQIFADNVRLVATPSPVNIWFVNVDDTVDMSISASISTSYAIQLLDAPSHPVIVTITPDAVMGANVTLNGGNPGEALVLTFTSANAPQTITIAAAAGRGTGRRHGNACPYDRIG